LAGENVSQDVINSQTGPGSNQTKHKKLAKKTKEMKIRAWRLALGGRKHLSGVDLHHANSLAQNVVIAAGNIYI
jgi:hypothetical protein